MRCTRVHRDSSRAILYLFEAILRKIMIKLKVNSLAGLRIIEVNLILAQSDCSNTTLLILLASIINFWHHPLVIVGELELRIIVNLYAPSIGASLSLNS